MYMEWCPIIDQVILIVAYNSSLIRSGRGWLRMAEDHITYKLADVCSGFMNSTKKENIYTYCKVSLIMSTVIRNS